MELINLMNLGLAIYLMWANFARNHEVEKTMAKDLLKIAKLRYRIDELSKEVEQMKKEVSELRQRVESLEAKQ